MHNDIEELKMLITHNLDVIDLLDLLDISFGDLVELLEEQIENNYEKCLRACR